MPVKDKTKKHCSKCDLNKDLNMFNKRGNSLRSTCKDCDKLYNNQQAIIRNTEKLEKEKLVDKSIKICSICKNTKKIEEFHLNKGSHRAACKDCTSIKNKEYNAKKKVIEIIPEKIKCSDCKIEKSLLCFSLCSGKANTICRDCNEKKPKKKNLTITIGSNSDSDSDSNSDNDITDKTKETVTKSNNIESKQKLTRNRPCTNIVDKDGNKKCTDCEIIKNVELFRKTGVKPNGEIKRRAECKECEKRKGRDAGKTDKRKEQKKKYQEEHKEKLAVIKSEWTKNNRERVNKSYNKRYHSDNNNLKLKKTISARVINVYKSNKNPSIINSDVGCSYGLFKKWIDYCKKETMTLDNHGKTWHLDHVIPVNKFDLMDDEELKTCYNFKNYMPVSADFNLTKNDRLDKEQLKLHIKNLREFHKKEKIIIDEEYMENLARHLN